MRYFKNILVFQLAIFICSCASNRKLIEKSKTEFGRIKFYAVNTSQGRFSISKIYAAVDSNGVKRYYSFYPQGIVMTDERAKNLSYTVLFQRQLPDNYDSNVYHRLSRLDTLVFVKVQRLLNNPEYSHLKSPKGAKGYEIEVYYMHGFPENKRFKPL